MTVRDIDKGWKNSVKQVKFWQSHDIVMGWIAGVRENRDTEGGVSQEITNADLALVHEFGTSDGHIPPGRLGLREWADRSKQEIAGRITIAYKNAIPHGNAQREMEKVGLWAVAAWKKYLRDVQPGPVLDHSTLDRRKKGTGKARGRAPKKLIDTAQLINGATHQVRRKGT